MPAVARQASLLSATGLREHHALDDAKSNRLSGMAPK